MANNIKTRAKLTLYAKVDIVEFLTDLQRCFMSRKNTPDEDFKSLSKLETAILKQTVSFRQFCISDLFHAVDK